MPPLPLPATPQRRTERKRQPSPPPLIAKIEYGEPIKIKRDGRTVRYHDWNKDPGDVAVLLNLAQKHLKVKYTHKRARLSTFPADGARYPIFYYTGSHDFTLSKKQVKHLRKFVQNGGTIWGDACFGDPEFFKAFVREMSRVLPDRSFHQLSPDHPLFRSHFQIKNVKYTRDVPDAEDGEGPPVLYGMELGCRTPIILSRYDLSCGWDGHIRDGAMSVHPSDARSLGINMIAYALATQRIGQYQSTARVFYGQDREDAAGFQFAQAKIGDNWDTQTNAIANLLKTVATETSTDVKFAHKAVDITDDQLLQYPFLYLTGHRDFTLSEKQVAALRRYLRRGGFLLASPCCGSKKFNQAFRREIKRVLPDKSLSKLPADHAVYHIKNNISKVNYNRYMQRMEQNGPPHPLEAITLNGTTAIIYTPYGLGGGWRGFAHPYARNIAPDDAMALGVNIILYAMTH